MDEQFEALAQRIADEVEKRFSQRFDEAERRLDARFDDAERRLSDGARVHAENLEHEIKIAAEGYGATLESIDRELKRLDTKWDTQIADHNSVLLDHGKRIRKLETSLADRRSLR